MSDQASPQTQANLDAMAGGDPLLETRTRLDSRWVKKIAVFLIISMGLMIWGLVDALYFYPRAGMRDAEFKLLQHLEVANAQSRMSDVSVAEPKERYASLDAAPPVNDFERTRFAWLEALKFAGGLTPENTTVADPSARLGELRAEWSSQKTPKPLAEWDLPLQWIITLVGAVCSALVIVNIVRSKNRVYRWENASKRLTLPDGRSFTPGELADVDKSKWHKYFVKITPRSGAPFELDLLKHQPLEAWYLEIEKIAFPDAVSGADEDDEPAGSGEADEASSQGEEAKS